MSNSKERKFQERPRRSLFETVGQIKMRQGGARDGRDLEGSRCVGSTRERARRIACLLVEALGGREGVIKSARLKNLLYFSNCFSQRGKENSSPLVPSSLLDLSEMPTTVRRRQCSPVCKYRSVSVCVCACLCVHRASLLLPACSVP